ncbi:MAG: class II fructose-bisphosphate aldolase [Bryobacteraceae bacterium]
MNLPLMIGVSEGEREFIGVKEIALLVRTARDEYGVSVYLNADHTHSLEKAKAAAEAGFDEIIFDASRKPFDQNIRETKQAVEILKSIRPEIVVEGEVGYIGSSSEIVETVPTESLKLTTPQEAVQFVAETKVDVWAPAVGNMHGLLPSMVRGETHKRLDIERIRQIKQATGSIPYTARRFGDRGWRFRCRDSSRCHDNPHQRRTARRVAARDRKQPDGSRSRGYTV